MPGLLSKSRSRWKKKNRSTISRIVADLHSPGRVTSSLVVETGFPTSVVNLVVKNGFRLKKSRKLEEEDGEEENLEISDPVAVSCAIKSGGVSSCLTFVDGIYEIMDEADEEDPWIKWLRLSMIVILGLSSKDMLIHFGISFLALVLLELFWGNIFLLLNPWSGWETIGQIVGETIVSSCENEVIESELNEEAIQPKNNCEVDWIGFEESLIQDKTKIKLIRKRIIKALVPKKLRSSKKRTYERKEEESEEKAKPFIPETSTKETMAEETSLEDEDKVVVRLRIEGEDEKRGNLFFLVTVVVLVGLSMGRTSAFFLTVGSYALWQSLGKG